MNVRGKVAVACLLLVLLAIALVSAKSLQIFVQTSRSMPTAVYVNEENFKEKLDRLENQYNELYANMRSIKANLNDYLYLSLFGLKIVKAYDRAILDALRSGNVSEAVKLMQKRDLFEQKNLMILLNALSSRASKITYSPMGWFDSAGNHHNFGDYILLGENYAFEVTDCYSAIGKSHVLKGDKITIKGFIYRPQTTGEEFKVILIDPHGKRVLLWDGSVGENYTTRNFAIRWSWCYFNITIDTKDMTCGLKQVDLVSGNDTVSVQFVVVKPYLKVYHYDGWTEIVTNRPSVVVDGKPMHPINGILWIPKENPKIS